MSIAKAAPVPSFDALGFRIDECGQAHFDATFFLRHRLDLLSRCPLDNRVDHMDLILSWYLLHMEQGGSRNTHLDALLQEVDIDRACGQGFHCPPSRREVIVRFPRVSIA